MINRYFHTLLHLKPVQLRYQLAYRLRSFWRNFAGFKYSLSANEEGNPLKLKPVIEKYTSLINNHFTFLNRTSTFELSKIDWSFSEFGKLWTYNLNYFDFLCQKGMEKEAGLMLINDFINQLPSNKTGLEPYPISLRGVNWIKFLSIHQIRIPEIDNSLFAQYQILTDNIEYHLMGNHLLENAFSLLFGAFYFKEQKFYNLASKIIEQELEEQILKDGAHFELSPMYHQIILDRLLDCVNLLQNNDGFNGLNKQLLLLEQKAISMIGWLKNMTFQNGTIAHFNDSTENIAPTTSQLVEYANRLTLQLQIPNSKLYASGYRRFEGVCYECIVDAGPIGAAYIPGHAHADMMSFVLYVEGKPVVVDSGISTYEKNSQRQLERSTSAHNTVVVNNKNQSDVWGGFRVGKRAQIKVLRDNTNELEAEHSGYKPVIHKRQFLFENDNFKIADSLSIKTRDAIAFLHFHAKREVELIDRKIVIDNKYCIEFQKETKIKIEHFQQPMGYNKFLSSKKAVIQFERELEMLFNFE